MNNEENLTFSEIYDMIEKSANKVEIYKLLTEEGLNPTMFYMYPDKVLTANDKRKLMVVRLKHEF